MQSTELGQTRNIWCVGRNYSEHAKELGHAVPSATGEPLVFLKAGSSIVGPGSKFKFPPFLKPTEVHHELELAFRFGPDLQLDAIAVALDFTAREIQSNLKSQGQPWTLAKSFQGACAVGHLVPLPSSIDYKQINFKLTLDGQLRQHGHSADMIHSVEKLRAYVVDRFPVVPGDLLLTGTPEGVGPLKTGCTLEAEIEDMPKSLSRWTLAD